MGVEPHEVLQVGDDATLDALAAITAGMSQALALGNFDPDLVAVEARRHQHHDTTAPPQLSLPQRVAPDQRPVPTLAGYDALIGVGA